MARAAPLLRCIALAASLAGAACGRAPKLAELPAASLPADAAPKIELESAVAAATDRKLVVTYRLTDRGVPITGANAVALDPRWIVAWLDVEPVSRLPAWQSLLLTGSQTAPSLPPAGPGTPSAEVLPDAKQPGYEVGYPKDPTTSGVTAELGDGRFTYTFKDALDAPSPPGNVELRSETLRVAVYLDKATGTTFTNATLDFRPDGGTPVAQYDTVTDGNCNACHGTLSAHGGRRIGVKLCVACHTWLCADPDTVDPAALNGNLPATKAAYPNPMEMGRLTHRIHRGKNLPTLYLSSSAATWPTVPFSLAPPLPFMASRNALAPVGSKFSAIGRNSAEYVYGRVASRVENFQPALTLAEGVAYPQDLRNCDACHGGAPQAAATVTSISRRTCSGCHPDVFYGDPNDLALTTPDTTHFAHTGGRQLDDATCVDCHVRDCPTVDPTGCGTRKLYAPIAEIHRPLTDRVASGSPHWSRVKVSIVDVQDMQPGLAPVITFRIFDRTGIIDPLNTTVDEAPGSAASPVPRAIAPTFILSGPTSDYLTGNVSLRAQPAASLAADASGDFTFTSATLLPATASGTWAVGVEGRRRATPAFYTAATDTFNWPFTGEQVTEWITEWSTSDVEYVVRFVDLATGTFATDPSAARRRVVSQAKCEKCHLELNLHGGFRHDVGECLLCHAPDATDWSVRPRDTRTETDPGGPGTGMVLLNNPIDAAATTKRWGYATVDGIEERSINLKTMLHRIHVGERVGAASLEGIRPYAVYGRSDPATAKPSPVFFDDIRYPNDLANCEVCHLPNTWTLESIPAGAQPTTANERGTILHTGTAATNATAAHPSGEPNVLPVTGTCLTCHTSGTAAQHAADETSGGVERCASCHGARGAQSIRRTHAVP